MDIVTVKQRQQVAWASGDYAAVGARFPIIAELLCESVDLRADERVLDVACGHGNAALAAARRFCQVTGVDYVPALLDRARRRAEAEGLEATFQEGDAEALPFGDDSFDVVLSACGAMFAPDQERTASELLRVCRPGGRIGMVNWTPDSYVGELFRAIGRHLPPPPGVRPPVLWGSEERLHELFGPGVSISAPRRSFRWRFPSASTRWRSLPPSTAPPSRRSQRSATAAPPSGPTCWRRPGASTSPTATRWCCGWTT